MRIEAVGFRGFPPFTDTTIEFPELKSDGLAEVHLLVGRNGTGKTRLLCLVAAACGNTADLDARHTFTATSNALVVATAKEGIRGIYFANPLPRVMHPSLLFITPHLHQDLNALALLRVAGSLSAEVQHHDGFSSLLECASSNRTPAAVVSAKGTGLIDDAAIDVLKDPATTGFTGSLSFERSKDRDEETTRTIAYLIMSAGLDARRGVKADSRALRMLERIEHALSELTGAPFSFDLTNPPNPQLMATWGKTSMKLSQLPDGLRSILGSVVGWIAKFSAEFPDLADPLSIPAIMLIDEPESHLHPAWQRQIIPLVQRLFFNSQIFVATHSPFVISSVNHGWIHILRADAEGNVTADAPRPCSEGDTYQDVVEDILDISPVQAYDPETEMLLTEFSALKDSVLKNEAEFEKAEESAKVIAGRSLSLSHIMGREIAQLRRQLDQKRASA